MSQNGRPISNNVPSQPRCLGWINLRGTPALLVVIVVMGLVGWLYLSQASEATETTRRIRELRQQKEELQRQNDQLTYDVARLASVDRLEERARELGYVTVWEARFLVVTDYPVQGGDTTVEAMASAQNGSAERKTSSAVVSWWKTIAGQFEVWASADEP
jgi:type II secretory pathway pseudopilin PulG